MSTGFRVPILLAATLMTGLGGSPAAPVRAESHEPTLKIFTITDADFVALDTPEGTALLAAPMAVPGMSGGIARFVKGENKLENWTYWYPEVVYVVRGRGRITAALPPFTESEAHEVGPGAFFFIPPSMRISFEALSDEPFDIFYAVPE